MGCGHDGNPIGACAAKLEDPLAAWAAIGALIVGEETNERCKGVRVLIP
jgi:hypothetical protein